MGYETSYYGTIKLSSKEIGEKILKIINDSDEDLEGHFGLEEIKIIGTSLTINGWGKIYEDVLEKFCLFVAKVDKKSYGEIECSGEEEEDYWRVVIKDGKAIIQNGEIRYDEKSGREFKDNDVNKDVYKITKDKTLLKEIIVEELKDGS